MENKSLEELIVLKRIIEVYEMQPVVQKYIKLKEELEKYTELSESDNKIETKTK